MVDGMVIQVKTRSIRACCGAASIFCSIRMMFDLDLLLKFENRDNSGVGEINLQSITDEAEF
jgi:hypothetical protein